MVIRCTVRDSLKFMNSVYSSFVNILFVIYGLIRFTNEMICRLSFKNMNKIKYESKVWVNILVCSVLRKTIRIRFKTTNFVENNRKHSHSVQSVLLRNITKSFIVILENDSIWTFNRFSFNFDYFDEIKKHFFFLKTNQCRNTRISRTYRGVSGITILVSEYNIRIDVIAILWSMRFGFVARRAERRVSIYYGPCHFQRTRCRRISKMIRTRLIIHYGDGCSWYPRTRV